MRNDIIQQAIDIKRHTNIRVNNLLTVGVKNMIHYCAETGKEPTADSGVYAEKVESWIPNKEYKRNELFSYNGNLGYVKQAHTSLDIYPPFSTGTEALYGSRPAPDEEGIYPYAYNMAAEIGMLVRDPDDGKIYECYQTINNMIFKPHEIAAHFKLVE